MPVPAPTETRTITEEAQALWQLAWPIVLAQVGLMFMGVVDTAFAGPLGAESLGALAIGNISFFALFVLGAGTLRSLEAYASQAFGAGRLDDCANGLAQAHWMAAVLTLPIAGLILGVPLFLELIGYDQTLVAITRDYIQPTVWGLPGALLFAGYRSFLSATNVTKPIMLAALLANGANWVLDWILIDGKLGAPALGVIGIAWSTAACRYVMFGVLAATVALHPQFREFPPLFRKPDPVLMKELARIGVPVGLTIFAEVGAFGGVGVLMGLKGAVPLAAHQVALNVTALLFMVPLGLSSGAAVRTGQALGAGSVDAVDRAGRTALTIGLCFSLVSSSLLWVFRHDVGKLYRVTDDVLAITGVLLGVAALFQVVDVLQVLGNGVLRGLGDTRLPFWFTFLGYAVLGLPLGYVGSFVWSDDPVWLWYGLTLGLSIVAVLAIARFRWQVRRLRLGDGIDAAPGRRPAIG